MAENKTDKTVKGPNLSDIMPGAGIIAQPLADWLKEGEILPTISNIIATPNKSALARYSSQVSYEGQAQYTENLQQKLSPEDLQTVDDIVNQALKQGDEENTAPNLNPKLNPENYSFQETNIPTVVQALLLFCYYEECVPPDVPCYVQLGKYGRNGRMKFIPPTRNDIVKRVVVHIGPDEVYKLTEIINGQIGDSKDIVMPKNTFIILGKNDFSNNNIFVSPNTRVEFPSVVPDNYGELAKKQMAKMGLSASNNKAINSDRVRNAVNTDSRFRRTTIRSQNYQRTTIIIDFGPSQLVLPPKKSSFIPGEIPDHIPKINDISQLPPHILASLPRGIGITPSLINKFAANEKLSTTVMGLVGSITDTLKESGLLQDGQNNMSSEVLQAVSKSAAETIGGDAFKNITPELNKVMKGIIPNKTGTKNSNRRARRKAQRAQAKEKKKEEKEEKEENVKENLTKKNETECTDDNDDRPIEELINQFVPQSDALGDGTLQNIIDNVKKSVGQGSKGFAFDETILGKGDDTSFQDIIGNIQDIVYSAKVSKTDTAS